MISIVFIDTIGIVYDGNSLNHRGLGGSESAVILMSRELAKLGFKVVVYNDCNDPMVDAKPGTYDGVEYRPFSQYQNETYDIVVSLRTVIPFAPEHIFQHFGNIPYKYNFAENIRSKTKLKIMWMHDTFCTGDQFLEELVVSGYIDEIFTLSDFHTAYVTNCDHGAKRMFEVLKRNIFETRNGITLYKNWVDITKKDKNLFVFNAAYNKGLEPLVKHIWPEVHKHIPQAKLVIIGGYYKFREAPPPDHTAENWTALVDQQTNDWHKLKNEYEGKDINITFTGIITQKQVADILEKASYFVYPTAFPETFGISMMESMAYNTPLITCRFGAMEETVPELASYKIDYPVVPNGLFPNINPDLQNARFVDAVIRAYNDPYLHQQKMYYCNIIKEICTWESVAVQWKQHFYNKLKQYLPVEDYRKAQEINNRVAEIYNRKFITEECKSINKTKENKIACIVPFYNCENYIERCIKSIVSQDYNNYEIVLINDCSDDDSINVAINYIYTLNDELANKIVIINNHENQGAVCNQVTTLRNRLYDDEDIILLIDGDDALINNPNVFNIINNKYNEGAEFTYGSCWSEVDNIPLISQPYPPEIKKEKKYRDYHFTWKMPYTHLRSFKKKLINDIPDLDFQDENGNWFRAGGDNSTFYNILEQADPDKVVCIPDILYLYNDKNPLNDYKVNSVEQNLTRDVIMNKKKVLIAIPTARYIEPETFKCIYDQEIPEGVEVDFQYFYGYRVDQVRNLIADWVVNGYDYLFAVDHDIVFAKDTLKKMLAADKDLVTGLYIQRNPGKILEIYNDKGRMNIKDVPENGLFPITACGFGCVLVKSKVLKEIGNPQFEYHVALDHNNTFSEDHDFCRKAITKGFRLYADSSIKCGHIGSYTYNVN